MREQKVSKIPKLSGLHSNCMKWERQVGNQFSHSCQGSSEILRVEKSVSNMKLGQDWTLDINM